MSLLKSVFKGMTSANDSRNNSVEKYTKLSNDDFHFKIDNSVKTVLRKHFWPSENLQDNNTAKYSSTHYVVPASTLQPAEKTCLPFNTSHWGLPCCVHNMLTPVFVLHLKIHISSLKQVSEEVPGKLKLYQRMRGIHSDCTRYTPCLYRVNNYRPPE